MTTLEELKSQISLAQARKAKAEVLRAQAEADLTAARQRLQEEFGVSTVEEARARLGELAEERDVAIAAAEAQLRESIT
jgi:hypothetical protein